MDCEIWSTEVRPTPGAAPRRWARIDVPHPAQLALAVDEIQQAAAEPRTAGMSSSPGPTALREWLVEQRRARSTVAAASSTRSAMAQTEGRG